MFYFVKKYRKKLKSHVYIINDTFLTKALVVNNLSYFCIVVDRQELICTKLYYFFPIRDLL